jgi:hypothetical protein
VGTEAHRPTKGHLEENSMTRADAINKLTAAFAGTIGADDSVNEALAAFAAFGERITDITLQIDIETELLPASGTRASAPAEDANFLRSLRIAPDLTPEGN